MCLTYARQAVYPYYFFIKYYIHTIAPVAPPQNVNATSYTPTSIIVCFEFPEGSTQNGQITSFSVTLVGSPFDTEPQTISFPVTSVDYPLSGSLCGDITGLQEYNSYTIALDLIDSVGSGPSSALIDVQTLVAGICFKILCFIEYCYSSDIFLCNFSMLQVSMVCVKDCQVG